ncbi:hypothetical protein HKX48_001369, partial [Thoreauomyces humboldtii]
MLADPVVPSTLVDLTDDHDQDDAKVEPSLFVPGLEEAFPSIAEQTSVQRFQLAADARYNARRMTEIRADLKNLENDLCVQSQHHGSSSSLEGGADDDRSFDHAYTTRRMTELREDLERREETGYNARRISELRDELCMLKERRIADSSREVPLPDHQAFEEVYVVRRIKEVIMEIQAREADVEAGVSDALEQEGSFSKDEKDDVMLSHVAADVEVESRFSASMSSEMEQGTTSVKDDQDDVILIESDEDDRATRMRRTSSKRPCPMESDNHDDIPLRRSVGRGKLRRRSSVVGNDQRASPQEDFSAGSTGSSRVEDISNGTAAWTNDFSGQGSPMFTERDSSPIEDLDLPPAKLEEPEQSSAEDEPSYSPASSSHRDRWSSSLQQARPFKLEAATRDVHISPAPARIPRRFVKRSRHQASSEDRLHRAPPQIKIDMPHVLDATGSPRPDLAHLRWSAVADGTVPPGASERPGFHRFDHIATFLGGNRQHTFPKLTISKISHIPQFLKDINYATCRIATMTREWNVFLPPGPGDHGVMLTEDLEVQTNIIYEVFIQNSKKDKLWRYHG